MVQKCPQRFAYRSRYFIRTGAKKSTVSRSLDLAKSWYRFWGIDKFTPRLVVEVQILLRTPRCPHGFPPQQCWPLCGRHLYISFHFSFLVFLCPCGSLFVCLFVSFVESLFTVAVACCVWVVPDWRWWVFSESSLSRLWFRCTLLVNRCCLGTLVFAFKLTFFFFKFKYVIV